MLRGGGGGGRETLVVPTGAPQPSGDYLGQFADALADIRGRLDDMEQDSNNNTDGGNVPSPTQPVPPTSGGSGTDPMGGQPARPAGTVQWGVSNTPAGFDFGTWILGLRERFPAIASRVAQPSVSGETPAERLARLQRELPYYGTAGTAFDLGTYVQGLRDLYGTQYQGTQAAGETPTERAERLWSEVNAFARSGYTSLTQPTTIPAPSVS